MEQFISVTHFNKMSLETPLPVTAAPHPSVLQMEDSVPGIGARKGMVLFGVTRETG